MSKPSAVQKIIASLEADKADHLAKIEVIDYAIKKLQLSQPVAKPKSKPRPLKPAAPAAMEQS